MKWKKGTDGGAGKRVRCLRFTAVRARAYIVRFKGTSQFTSHSKRLQGEIKASECGLTMEGI